MLNSKKIIITIVTLAILAITLLSSNIMGDGSIDPTKYLYLSYDTDEISDYVSVKSTLYAYSATGDYDDAIMDLSTYQDYLYDEDEGEIPVSIYSEEEAEELMPSDLSLSQVEFLKTCELERSSDEEMQNGDILEVTVNCDEQGAKDNNINMRKNVKKFEINKMLDPVSIEDFNSKNLVGLDFTDSDENEAFSSLYTGADIYYIFSKTFYGYFYDEYYEEICLYVNYEIKYDDDMEVELFKKCATPIRRGKEIQYIDSYGDSTSRDPLDNSDMIKLDIKSISY